MTTKIAGNLTELLKLEYQIAGWRLSEDEHFVYLWPPDSREAYVFNSRNTTMEVIEAVIRKVD
jgi:hypothetical protein